LIGRGGGLKVVVRGEASLQLNPTARSSARITNRRSLFNKSGKTDILLRYETSNVFIAECKFWSGPKGLLKAIDQLFAYLTWRDSKAALVLFVRNQDFTSVLESIKQTIPTHAQFIRHVLDVHESWFEYRLSFPGDPGREVWF
jgi:hypothetical protein